MNRLLQHFVDSGGAQAPPATRASIPVPPQSSGGSYCAGHRGSFHRTTPGGPFYYQPPQPPSGLEEIPLTSQSTGAMYETVDLNADNSSHPWGHRPPSSRDGTRPKALSSASELFASGPPPSREVVSGNPYRRQSITSFASASGNVAMFEKGASPSNDPFACSSYNTEAMITAAQNDPFSAPRSQEHPPLVTNITATAAHLSTDPCTTHRQQIPHTPVDPFASSVVSSSCPFNSSTGDYPSADQLFTSPEPCNTSKWVHSQPPVQAQELFASAPPSASSLFGNSSPFHATASPCQSIAPSPPKLQVRAPPSPGPSQVPKPVHSPLHVPPSPMKPPLASPPQSPHNKSPASPGMRPEDHVMGAFKPVYPRKHSLKSGLDVRHMKVPATKQDDDVLSNAPSFAPSRMSMLSTLDDSLKLSDMYKHMATRLEGEKHELLQVVARQAHEMAQMQKHIKALELQVKKCQVQAPSELGG